VRDACRLARYGGVKELRRWPAHAIEQLFYYAVTPEAEPPGITPVLMMVGIFAIFYFLLIMPQQRKQKKWQAMLSQLKTGDKIVTRGGLHGTIISLKDDAITLRVPPDNVKLEVSRGSVVSVTTPEEKEK
jgi:preprotein translocase subunit YajC